jgi:hypothetical protein
MPTDTISICIDVGDCGICSEYFTTLGEIPINTVSIRIYVGDYGIYSKYFATLGKIPTDGFHL